MEKSLVGESNLVTVSPETPTERTDLTNLCDQYTRKFRELMPEPGQLEGEKLQSWTIRIENDETLRSLIDRIKEHVVVRDLDQEFGFAEVKRVQELLQKGCSINAIRNDILLGNQR